MSRSRKIRFVSLLLALTAALTFGCSQEQLETTSSNCGIRRIRPHCSADPGTETADL